MAPAMWRFHTTKGETMMIIKELQEDSTKLKVFLGLLFLLLIIFAVTSIVAVQKLKTVADECNKHWESQIARRDNSFPALQLPRDLDMFVANNKSLN